MRPGECCRDTDEQAGDKNEKADTVKDFLLMSTT